MRCLCWGENAGDSADLPVPLSPWEGDGAKPRTLAGRRHAPYRPMARTAGLHVGPRARGATHFDALRGTFRTVLFPNPHYMVELSDVVLMRKSRLKSPGVSVQRPWQVNKNLPRAMKSPIPMNRRDSRLAKEVFQLRTDIVAALGGPDALSPIQIQTLELICQLKARLLSMDKEFVEAGAEASGLSYTTTRAYLSLMHGMLRALRELGLSGLALAKQRPGPSGLAERLSLLQGGKKAVNE